MGLPHERSPRGPRRRRLIQWSALTLGAILPTVGCQVEYAGMTLPSGRYMHDDVQYFQDGPDFPWANTQAATQRARMRAMGIEPPPEPGVVPVPVGAPRPGMPLGGGTIPTPGAVPPAARNVPAPAAPAPGNVPATAPTGVPGGPGGAPAVPPPPTGGAQRDGL